MSNSPHISEPCTKLQFLVLVLSLMVLTSCIFKPSLSNRNVSKHPVINTVIHCPKKNKVAHSLSTAVHLQDSSVRDDVIMGTWPPQDYVSRSCLWTWAPYASPYQIFSMQNCLGYLSTLPPITFITMILPKWILRKRCPASFLHCRVGHWLLVDF